MLSHALSVSRTDPGGCFSMGPCGPCLLFQGNYKCFFFLASVSSSAGLTIPDWHKSRRHFNTVSKSGPSQMIFFFWLTTLLNLPKKVSSSKHHCISYWQMPPISTPNPCGTRCECPGWLENWLGFPRITSGIEYHPHGKWMIFTSENFWKQTSVILQLSLYFLGLSNNAEEAAQEAAAAWPLFEIQVTVERKARFAYFLGRTRFLLWLFMLWWY